MCAKAENESWNDLHAEEQIRVITTCCQFLTVVVYVWWQKEKSQFVALGRILSHGKILTTFW